MEPQPQITSSSLPGIISPDSAPTEAAPGTASWYISVDRCFAPQAPCAMPPPPLCTPQVVKDFQGECITAREAAHSTAEVVEAELGSRKRQLAWLLKSHFVSKQKAAWRPRKRYRVASAKMLETVDHQLQVSGVERGLAFYQQAEWPAQSWASWPLLHLTLDQESSNLTSVHWLSSQNCNIEATWDGAHGAWNDIKRAASDTGRYAWLLSLLLTWNIPHGPWWEGSRSSQCREAVRAMCVKEWSEVSPLFEARAYEMLRERNDFGRLADEGVLQDMWSEFKASSPFDNKGSKVSLNRFMSLVKVGRFEMAVWAVRKLVYEYVCLELDLLGSKKVGEVVMEQQARQVDQENEGERGNTSGTNPLKLDIVDSALRKGTANAMVCGLLILSSPLAWRRLCVFIEFTDGVDKWHSEMSCATRSCSESSEWLFRQVVGHDSMRHIGVLWLGVSQRGALGRQTFWLPNADQPSASESTVVVEDLLAEEVGHWCLALVYRRLQRTLPMVCGWPDSSIRFLGDSEVATSEMSRLRQDVQNFGVLCGAIHQHAHLHEMKVRSLFTRRCVRQLVAGC